jgi:hypothetical protein
MHETTDLQAEDAMNRPLGTLAAAATGALTMYYLDPELGARRRALLAERVRSGLPGGSGRRRRPRPALPTWVSVAVADPQEDAELRHRIQGRLGRLVSHPRALYVSVDRSVVRLSGRVLAKERDGLLEQVRQMDGVHRVVDAMSAHDHPQEIAQQPETVSLAAASG